MGGATHLGGGSGARAGRAGASRRGPVREEACERGQEARPLVAQGAEQRLVLRFRRGGYREAGDVVGDPEVPLLDHPPEVAHEVACPLGVVVEVGEVVGQQVLRPSACASCACWLAT